jgi:hypothetical protein
VNSGSLLLIDHSKKGFPGAMLSFLPPAPIDHLQRILLNLLKIDKPFVHSLQTAENTYALPQSTKVFPKIYEKTVSEIATRCFTMRNFSSFDFCRVDQLLHRSDTYVDELFRTPRRTRLLRAISDKQLLSC